MPAWVIPAISAAAGLIGQGIAAGKDKRQLKQQGKLNDQQIEANDRMLGIQNKHALQMWKDTNYDAQKGEMMKAELNPALMYGMGGGGGTTTSTPSANVSATKAQGRTGRESEEATALAMQIISQTELLKAQKENVQADTKNKLAQAEVAPVTSENLRAQTGKTIQDTKGSELQNKFLENSMTDRLSAVSSEAVQEIQKAQQMVNDTNVSDATIQDRIKIIKQDAIGKVLDNALMKIEQSVKNVNINKAKAEIKAIAQYVEQGWRKLSQGEVQNQQGWDRINIDKNRNYIMQKLGEAGLDLQDRGQILQTITGVMGMGASIIPKTTHSQWFSEDSKGNMSQGHSTQKR